MLVVLLTACLLTLLCVGIHYNALALLTRILKSRDYHVRRWVAFSILGLIFAHVIEVSIFSLGYGILEGQEDYGELIGNVKQDISDYWYFSFVVYTSLGFGDITPKDNLRLMTAFETLTGLIMIAWSASFIFMQMQRFWADEQAPS